MFGFPPEFRKTGRKYRSERSERKGIDAKRCQKRRIERRKAGIEMKKKKEQKEREVEVKLEGCE